MQRELYASALLSSLPFSGVLISPQALTLAMASDDGGIKHLLRLARGDNVETSWMTRLGRISAVFAGRAPFEFPKIAKTSMCACIDFVQLSGAKVGLLSGFVNESSGRERFREEPLCAFELSVQYFQYRGSFALLVIRRLDFNREVPLEILHQCALDQASLAPPPTLLPPLLRKLNNELIQQIRMPNKLSQFMIALLSLMRQLAPGRPRNVSLRRDENLLCDLDSRSLGGSLELLNRWGGLHLGLRRRGCGRGGCCSSHCTADSLIGFESVLRFGGNGRCNFNFCWVMSTWLFTLRRRLNVADGRARE